MASVVLSRIPGPGRELEDFVAGLFQAAGYFVERGIHERASSDVLELDAVATSYDEGAPIAVLIEAKGGRWGFPDVFKVVGWMRYLGISKGGFFVSDAAPKDLSVVRRRIGPLGVSVVDLADFRDPPGSFRQAGFGTIRDPELTWLWRHSFWVERCLLDRLRATRRATPKLRGATEVLGYHDLVNDHVFFIRDASERLCRLYEAYRVHPKLTLALADELAGGTFGVAVPHKSKLLAEAMYEGKHPELQASLYVEHRARVSILKSAVDILCNGSGGASGNGPSTPGGVCLDDLPATFRDGLRALNGRATFRRYALLWQVFLWGFGGFYLADRADEELGWLSDQTGVPRAEIPAALRAFDDLFPLADGGWTAPVRGTKIVVAKMVPSQFRGIGAIQRLRRLGLRTYRDLGYRDETGRTLTRWHNDAVALLRG